MVSTSKLPATFPFPERLKVTFGDSDLAQEATLHFLSNVTDSLEAATKILQSHHGYLGTKLLRNEQKIPIWPKEYLGSISHKALREKDSCAGEPSQVWTALIAKKPEGAHSFGVDLERIMKPSLIERLIASRGDRWSGLASECARKLQRAEEEIWTALFSIFETSVKCVGNANRTVPLIPESFELQDLTRTSDPGVAQFRLTVSPRSRTDQIAGKVHFTKEWVLSYGYLTDGSPPQTVV